MQTADDIRLRIQSGNVGGLLELFEARASDTSGAALLLTGAPGIGKSTSLDALLRGLARRTARAFRVSADEPSRRQPFGLISSLVGLVPEYPPGPDVGDRVLAAIEDLCGYGPLVLCADDLHHADGDSLRVLTQLLGATRDLPLTVVMARRPLPIREQLVSLAARPEVLAVEVVPMDRAAMARLVRQTWGIGADPELLDQLAVTGGNPFHASALLEQLRRASTPGSPTPATVPGDDMRSPETLEATVRGQLALLDHTARDLLQILAVWGRPADVLDLASIAGSPTGTVLRGVQAAVDSGIADWTSDDKLGFSHDLYSDVIVADLAPGLRRLLHAACARQLESSGAMATEVAGHAADARSDGLDAARVIALATTDLAFAPEQAADLLATVRAVPGSPEAGALAVARAGALAAAGRMTDSEQVALDGLAVVRDTPTRQTLTRLLLHTTVSAADSASALQRIDQALHDPTLTEEPGPEATRGADHTGSHDPPGADTSTGFRHALIHMRRWVMVLDGTEPIPEQPDPGPIRSGAALVPTAMQLFQRARCVDALAMVQEAQRARLARGAPVWGDGVTAPVWPAWFALFGQGPQPAQQLSLDARREAQQQGRGWLWPYHLSIAGTIDQFTGRWDDAAAVFAESAEAASSTGTGWVSRGLGCQLIIFVQRGQIDDAEAVWASWQASGRRNEQALPYTTLGAMLLAEATARTHDAARLAAEVWGQPHVSGRLLWALLSAPEVLRVARAAGATELVARVLDDVSRISTDQAPALAGVPLLVRAVATGDHALAAQAAGAFRRAGHVTGELYALEEAAVAAAADGEKDLARTWARRALDMADTLTARTIERRISGRLRDHHVRLGATGARRRPSTGWDSLTPTELRVAEQVAAGLTSPQIAGQLYLSPRTVQTHITHILRKLDLRSRVELATAWTRRP